jgi:hypothetical protein
MTHRSAIFAHDKVVVVTANLMGGHTESGDLNFLQGRQRRRQQTHLDLFGDLHFPFLLAHQQQAPNLLFITPGDTNLSGNIFQQGNKFGGKHPFAGARKSGQNTHRFPFKNNRQMGKAGDAFGLNDG